MMGNHFTLTIAALVTFTVMLKYMFEEQNCYLLQSSKLQVKAEFTETCSLAD